MSREGDAACRGEGRLAARRASPLRERGVACPARLFVCVHTALACARGGRGPQTDGSGDARGPEPPRGSVPPGLVLVCVRARVPWRGGSCGRGLGETLGLRVSWVAEGGPGQRRAAVPLLASPTPPTPEPDSAGWPSTWRLRRLVWLGPEDPRGACESRPRPPHLTLGPGRSVGARGRACCCLRRSWRE